MNDYFKDMIYCVKREFKEKYSRSNNDTLKHKLYEDKITKSNVNVGDKVVMRKFPIQKNIFLCSIFFVLIRNQESKVKEKISLQMINMDEKWKEKLSTPSYVKATYTPLSITSFIVRIKLLQTMMKHQDVILFDVGLY